MLLRMLPTSHEHLAVLCRELGSHSHHLEPDLPVRAQCAHSSGKLISSPPLSGQEEVEINLNSKDHKITWQQYATNNPREELQT